MPSTIVTLISTAIGVTVGYGGAACFLGSSPPTVKNPPVPVRWQPSDVVKRQEQGGVIRGGSIGTFLVNLSN